MKRVLVTGANGFVGRVLCETLESAGYIVRAALRRAPMAPVPASEACIVGDIGSRTDWSSAVADIDAIVHAAARVHVLSDVAANAALYYETNVEGTRRLLAAAEQSGVGRFIYLSSIKVNGEVTHAMPFTARDVPAPLDDYGRSKAAAEALIVASSGTIDVRIVRPPLVYGSGVRANFLRLMSWVDRGVPLPLGSVHNARSMVSVWNLCDLISRLLEVSSSSERIFLASDGCDMSTPELVKEIAHAMGKPARLLPVPVVLLRLAGALTGRRAEVARLCGSLRIDIATTRRALDWTPPLSVEAGIARTVRWFSETRHQ